MKKIIAMVEELKSDIDYYFRELDNTLVLTIDDFEGFDENWCEIDRKLENEEGVKYLIQYLKDNCIAYDDDLYIDYEFKGFRVRLGYSSFDI